MRATRAFVGDRRTARTTLDGSLHFKLFPFSFRLDGWDDLEGCSCKRENESALAAQNESASPERRESAGAAQAPSSVATDSSVVIETVAATSGSSSSTGAARPPCLACRAYA